MLNKVENLALDFEKRVNQIRSIEKSRLTIDLRYFSPQMVCLLIFILSNYSKIHIKLSTQ